MFQFAWNWNNFQLQSFGWNPALWFLLIQTNNFHMNSGSCWKVFILGCHQTEVIVCISFNLLRKTSILWSPFVIWLCLLCDVLYFIGHAEYLHVWMVVLSSTKAIIPLNRSCSMQRRTMICGVSLLSLSPSLCVSVCVCEADYNSGVFCICRNPFALF